MFLCNINKNIGSIHKNMISFRIISLIFIPLLLISIEAKPRSFEGNISFLRETVFDTTFIKIYVKNGLVRVDEYNSSQTIISSQIVNLKSEEVVALSHDQKRYARVPVAARLVNGKDNLDIRKTNNHKKINGVTCYQWRVRDVKRNTEVAYWVFEERFDFLESLLQLLNRTEYSFSAFSAIPDRDGFFPMLTEERTLLRKNKMRIAVVEINERHMDSSLFTVPHNYTSVRR